jgi:hypothetical protein
VNLTAILGEVSGNFGGEKRAGEMCDFQGAGDAVMIRNRHEPHAPLPGTAVDVDRLDEALRGADASQDPFARAIGMLAVDVKIDFSLSCRNEHSAPHFPCVQKECLPRSPKAPANEESQSSVPARGAGKIRWSPPWQKQLHSIRREKRHLAPTYSTKPYNSKAWIRLWLHENLAKFCHDKPTFFDPIRRA